MRYFKGHTDRIRWVAYSPSGTTLASCSADGTVRLWNVLTGKKGAKLGGHKRAVYAAAFSADGTTLATGGADRRIRLWQMPAGRVGKVHEGITALVTSLAFSADGTALFAGSGNSGPGVLTKWWPASGATRRIPMTIGVWCLALAPDARALAIGLASLPGELIFVDGKAMKVLTTKTQEHRVRALAYSPGGELVATADGPNVNLFTIGSEPPATLRGHTDTIQGVCFAADGRALATASHDGTLRLWDVARRTERACFDWKIGKFDCVAIAPDGMTIAAGGEKDVVVWDLDEL